MKRSTFDLTQPGWSILLAITVLMAIGVASIYVTDTHYASGNDGPANAARQFAYVLFAGALGAVVLRIGYHAVARHAYILFLLSSLALVPLFVARLTHSTFGGLTPPRNGTDRWIQLPGFQVQPSEFVKIAVVLALAWYLRHRNNYRRFSGLLLPFVLSAVPLSLILL
ncbi:MAG: FtsW/RodA/SpoVE family cell cycle protein, partial [Planctomycetes bacterium]|nr:FtsW/RodA/SpoVE family cell cycle protein [Planctomycetota bacterium]